MTLKQNPGSGEEAHRKNIWGKGHSGLRSTAALASLEGNNEASWPQLSENRGEWQAIGSWALNGHWDGYSFYWMWKRSGGYLGISDKIWLTFLRLPSSQTVQEQERTPENPSEGNNTTINPSVGWGDSCGGCMNGYFFNVFLNAGPTGWWLDWVWIERGKEESHYSQGLGQIHRKEGGRSGRLRQKWVGGRRRKTSNLVWCNKFEMPIRYQSGTIR